jgi:hypothetical protein
MRVNVQWQPGLRLKRSSASFEPVGFLDFHNIARCPLIKQNNRLPFLLIVDQHSATMAFMHKTLRTLFAVLCAVVCVTSAALAQSATGSLELTARISPTAARPEPVRQFTFYVLTKSYAEIVKEVEAQNALPSREKFIEGLKLSPELKEWLKAHDVFDLTMPGLDRLVTPDDILHVPEFLLAYQRSNSGGVTSGIPKPKYADADKTAHPDRYNKQLQEYYVALKKFIQNNPATVSGIELELVGVNPQQQWSQIQADHKRRVQRLAPEFAQTRYLAAKTDSDLDGHASVSGLAAGEYWLSTLNLDANAGDTHTGWDVPVVIHPGQTTRVELTNLNGVERQASTP